MTVPLPTLAALPEPEDVPGGVLVLCATHRLARHLRAAHDRARAAQGLARWRSLECLTVDQWLESVGTEALLAGEIPAGEAPRRVLEGQQEQVLWEMAVTAGLADRPEAPLFDLEGLAAAAREANELATVWDLPLPQVRDAAGPAESGEFAEFLGWRADFRRRCAAAGALEPCRHARWLVDRLGRGAGRLPAWVILAGFDRRNPLEEALLETLAARGVRLAELAAEGPPGHAHVLAVADAAAEHRAAAAWAAARLAANPEARLAIVVPDLAARRDALSLALDDALHPAALRPALAEAPRRYNLSLGAPLARQPLVGTALSLLALATGGGRAPQEALSALLLGPHFSADLADADARARLEARMRRELPPVVTLERFRRWLRRQVAAGMPLERLAGHLDRLVEPPPAGRRPPSEWVPAFRDLLAAVGWPGERSLSSHEWQARRAFLELLQGLARLDPVLGRVPAAEAARRLRAACRERVFQPETEGEPPVQVLGPLEAAGIRADAIWVMGMNDHLWPPPARPNPLLPAAVQRAAGTPGASAAVQAAFAARIQGRLRAAAPELVLSWARAEGDRPLRASPLLAGLPALEGAPVPPPSLRGAVAAMPIESLADHRAPPAGPAGGGTLSGGTGLLEAQAVCPAWAFHQYRLGARALPSPVEGFDARARGTLVHLALERFWAGRGAADLRGLEEAAREAAIAGAVADAVEGFAATLPERPADRFLALERERLALLLAEWLALEAERPGDFTVEAREAAREVDVEGLRLELRIDRADRLADGRRVLIDYKTGAAASPAAWARPRVTQLQLPLYAAWVMAGEPPAAVVLARVRRGDCGFAGVAAGDGLVPDVRGIGGHRSFPPEAFPDWASLLGHWRVSIAALAREFRDGDARVIDAGEQELRFCDVKPLLRLAERRRLAGTWNGEDGE
ncbi:MAG: PD-(D/E)XK nuclease family protein [Rhodocyclaceae bacterium]|nr:PD-(D/E)XK nuclease family protein [Rhodocyclaceae bacterium]